MDKIVKIFYLVNFFTFEVDLATHIIIKDIHNSLNQRILFQFRNRQKLTNTNRPRTILK